MADSKDILGLPEGEIALEDVFRLPGERGERIETEAADELRLEREEGERAARARERAATEEILAGSPFVEAPAFDFRPEARRQEQILGRTLKAREAGQRGMLARLGLTTGGAALGVERGTAEALGLGRVGIRARGVELQREWDRTEAARETAYNQWAAALRAGNEQRALNRQQRYQELTDRLSAIADENARQMEFQEEQAWSSFMRDVIGGLTGAGIGLVTGGPTGALTGGLAGTQG